MRFRTKILESGKTATGIEIPPEVMTSLGPRKRPAVRVTLRGYTYRSTVASVSGKFMVGVSADVRQRASVAGGDQVDVDIELDTAPREVSVPADLAKALSRDAKAKRFFDGLSYSQKNWHVLSIEGAKTAETRQRRIAKSVDMLREGGNR
jgi:hypothetical protein